MEDVLDVYQRPPDPKRPQVCLDEACKQLLAHKQAPLPMAPGPVERVDYQVDYQYEREGVANLFMLYEPLV